MANLPTEVGYDSLMVLCEVIVLKYASGIRNDSAMHYQQDFTAAFKSKQVNDSYITQYMATYSTYQCPLVKRSQKRAQLLTTLNCEQEAILSVFISIQFDEARDSAPDITRNSPSLWNHLTTSTDLLFDYIAQ